MKNRQCYTGFQCVPLGLIRAPLGCLAWELRGPLGKSPAPVSHAAQKPRREIDEDWSYLSSELFLWPLGERLDYLWQTLHRFSLRRTLLWATKGNHQRLIIPTEVTVMLSQFETHSQKRVFTPHVGGGISWVPDYFDIHSSPGSKLPAHNECIIIPLRPPWEQRVHISKINRTPGYWVGQGMEYSEVCSWVKISKKSSTKSVFNTWAPYHFHCRQVFSKISFRN